ncbi:AGAP010967-PA-like protein [Anopheles sinensis]|uniref:AGAP010967-PA-like protein n=1 Tax=Anopheles sinensis TaxID=74873 RepID=A0A084WQB3_ANOSI|nr:AGAP010967-PA-like protein [Anopheles sinensis]
MIVFLLSIAGCSTMIFKAYIKWDQSPIIVSFSERTTPVREVQFPAITICPETKVPAEQLNFTEEINGLYDKGEDVDSTYNPHTIGQLKAIAQVCASQFYKDHLSSFNATGEKNVVNILKNLSLDRNAVVEDCGYGDEACNLYMKETVTEAGLCYSFNMLPQSQMFRKDVLHNEHSYIEEWNETKFGGDAIPLNALGTGTTDSLWMYLATSKTDIDYTCAGDLQGFTMTLHESSAYPTMTKRSLFIPLDHRVQIAVKPQIITTSPSAADYHWSKRQCFFDNERYLQFFKIYNQDNCELECLTNITLAVCDCVRYSMPRTPGTDVCSFNKLDCMNHAPAHRYNMT